MAEMPTNAEMKAIGSAIYSFQFMVKEMRQIEGVAQEQIDFEYAKLKMAKRGYKKLREIRKASKSATASSGSGKE